MRMEYQPKIGARTSSRFITKRPSGRAWTIMNTSSIDWCLAAITTRPAGVGPRISVRTPPITRSAANTMLSQNLPHQRAARGDSAAAGKKITPPTAIVA